MLFGFAAPAGGGKDTCGLYFIERHGFKKLSFAGPLKAMLAAAGLPEPATQAQKEEIIPWLDVSWRHCAQTLGTEWGRSLIHPNIWVKMALRSMVPGANYVLTDVRFENEATAIREAGGSMFHITGRRAAMAAGTQGHASETGIAMAQGDFVIDNSGTLKELYADLGTTFSDICAAQR